MSLELLSFTINNEYYIELLLKYNCFWLPKKMQKIVSGT